MPNHEKIYQKYSKFRSIHTTKTNFFKKKKNLLITIEV